MSPDIALEEFKKIVDRKNKNKNLNEATTRCIILDDILEKVLGWSKDADFTCESYIKKFDEKKWADYKLKINGRPAVILEAKSLGADLNFDLNSTNRLYKLDGVISKQKELWDAIVQAQEYCVNEGIKIAIVSNGQQFILFEAFAEGIKWTEGMAIFFHSLEEISNKFSEFINIFSKDSIRNFNYVKFIRSNTNVFSEKLVDVLPLKRDIQRRNKIGLHLKELLEHVFSDLYNKNDPELFNECYVYDSRTNNYNRDIETLLKDRIPKWDYTEIDALKQSKEGAPIFEKALGEIPIKRDNSEVLYIIGDIGVGKTHFLHRFFFHLKPDLVEKYFLPIMVDFLNTGGPIEDSTSQEIKKFINDKILETLYEKEEWNIYHWDCTKEVYKKEVNRLKKGDLSVYLNNPEEFEKKLNEFIIELKKDTENYIKNLFNYIGARYQKKVCILIDNVDQYPFEFQKLIYKIGQQISNMYDCIVIISLRGENFWKSIQEDIVNIKPIRKVYSIPRLDFKQVFAKRVKFSEKILQKSSKPKNLIEFEDGKKISIANAPLSFLKSISHAILSDNYLASSIEALSNGNIRIALDFVVSVIESGHLNTNDIMNLINELDINPRILLNAGMNKEYRYYSDDEKNLFVNLFDCDSQEPHSHFIGIRLLRILDLHKDRDSRLGLGFVEKNYIYDKLFAFGYTKDLIDKFLLKFLKRRLIESEGKIKSDLDLCSFFKITSSGYFHLKELIFEPFYIKNVLIDVSIYDDKIYNKLKNIFKSGNYSVDNYSLVSNFIEYLEQEECQELANTNKSNIEPYIYKSFVNSIKNKFEDKTQILLSNFNLSENKKEIVNHIEKLLEKDEKFIKNIIITRHKKNKIIFVHLHSNPEEDIIYNNCFNKLSRFIYKNRTIRAFKIKKFY